MSRFLREYIDMRYIHLENINFIAMFFFKFCFIFIYLPKSQVFKIKPADERKFIDNFFNLAEVVFFFLIKFL